MTARETMPTIPSDIAEFIEFFSNDLAGIAFPDIDAETLEKLASRVRARADELADLTERVRSARDELQRAQAELRRQSERALAYVRVYADGHPDVCGALDRLALVSATVESKPARKRKAKGKSRGKPGVGKGDGPTGELPFADKDSEAA